MASAHRCYTQDWGRHMQLHLVDVQESLSGLNANLCHFGNSPFLWQSGKQMKWGQMASTLLVSCKGFQGEDPNFQWHPEEGSWKLELLVWQVRSHWFLHDLAPCCYFPELQSLVSVRWHMLHSSERSDEGTYRVLTEEVLCLMYVLPAADAVHKVTHLVPDGPEVGTQVSVGDVLQDQSQWLLQGAASHHVDNVGAVTHGDRLHGGNLLQKVSLQSNFSSSYRQQST